MLKKLLYGIVGWIARLHGYILRLNDASEYTFSDKALHFLVMGILGMALVFLLYPLFRYLARRRHEFTITWIYVFTLIVVDVCHLRHCPRVFPAVFPRQR